jgi:uncharacterized membrane protein YhaH (DUF805 family)
MKPKFSDLWRWTGPLERGAYLFWGVLLVALKFNLDRGIATGWFGKSWTAFARETWTLYLWQSPLPQELEPSLSLTLLIASLPFLWIGTVLTLRRLRDLGWRPFWVLLFFVPVVKLINRESQEMRSFHTSIGSTKGQLKICNAAPPPRRTEISGGPDMHSSLKINSFGGGSSEKLTTLRHTFSGLAFTTSEDRTASNAKAAAAYAPTPWPRHQQDHGAE